MTKRPWKIHKFGGSSLASADCFKRVAKILLDYDDTQIGVVVSAMGGMTDALINLTIQAEHSDDGYTKALNAIGKRYSETASSLLESNALPPILNAWSSDAKDIIDLLN